MADRDLNVKGTKEISEIIGEWGKWQTYIFLFCSLAAVFSAFNNLSSSFYATKVEYNCIINGTKMVYDCPPEDSGIVCDSWSYTKSEFSQTIISRWNLVCKKSWLASFTQSIYMFGIVISSLIFGYISDKYGRKKAIHISIIVEIFGGLSSIFASNIVIYTLARFILSIGCYGRNLSSFLLQLECVGPKYRSKIGIAYQFGWALGYIILPMLAYLTKDYINLHWSTTLPEFIFAIWMMNIPESPKWLVSNGKFDELKIVLDDALKKNNLSNEDLKEFINDLQEQNILKTNVLKNSNFFSIWKIRFIRNFTLILYLTWFVNSFVYYGISLNIENFGGNLFINFILAGLVEIPSYSLTILAFSYFRKKYITAYLMILAGLSCFSISFFSYVINSQTMVIVFAMIGKFCITSTFAIIYIYSAELYPTNLRHTAVGSCSVLARGGSILSPFIKEIILATNISFAMGLVGIFSLISGFLVFLLPETNDSNMPNNIEEVEEIYLKK